jgi:gliding motility-associated-like protein
LEFNPDGSFVYTPVLNFNGTDHFVYKLCDVDGDCSEAKVTITVNQVNDLPIANNDNFTYHLEGVLEASVADNDIPSGDGGNIWSVLTQPASGSVIFNSDGTFTYTPNENFIGTDSFTYQLCDANGDCVDAKVTIDIEDVIVPNQIFTPNGDGQNDTYHIEGIEYYPGCRLTVFNRWGNVVYQKTGYLNDWDGYSNASKVGSTALPVGTYFYVLDYGKDKHKAGYVYLER